ETYEKIKVGTNFERSIKNISDMVKIKKELGSPLPQLMFRYIVTKQNIGEAPDFIKIVSKIKENGQLRDDGYAEIEFTGLLAFKENESYALDLFPQDIKEKIVSEAKKYGIIVSFAHQNPKHKRPRHSCAAWVEPFIFVDGEVMACCAQNENNSREIQRKRSLGNLFKTPFKKIWNSDKYKQLRKNVPRKGAPAPEWCQCCRMTDI
ncbi:MAG: SPASM domain-containing protein, partial [Patescibacteria group bacterium]